LIVISDVGVPDVKKASIYNMLHFQPIMNVALDSIRSGLLYQQGATDCQISDDWAAVSSWIHHHAFIDQVFQQHADIINIPAVNEANDVIASRST